MAQLMCQGQRPQGTDSVGEEGVGAIERVNITVPVAGLAPTAGLHGTADLQCQLVEFQLGLILRESTLEHQSPQVAVGADVIEPVIMDPGVGDV